MGRGFITGTGIKEGAFATTVTWDTGNILTAGSSEEDMALAVNRLIEIQGGYVISRNGRISYEFPMPVYSLVPDYGLEEISRKTKDLDAKMEEIGIYAAAAVSRPSDHTFYRSPIPPDHGQGPCRHQDQATGLAFL